MTVRLHEEVDRDFERGYYFYEAAAPGTGDYFLSSILAERQLADR